jgi:AcrR family transcriptional regulator
MGSNDTQGARLPLRGEAGVTIRDVAKALNISHTTVSRALADSPKISDETKSRVRAVVAQMGYVPSASARMMRGRRSSLVGLIIPDVQNDFYATVAKIVADSLASHSMQLLLSVTDDNPERELRELRAILERAPLESSLSRQRCLARKPARYCGMSKRCSSCVYTPILLEAPSLSMIVRASRQQPGISLIVAINGSHSWVATKHSVRDGRDLVASKTRWPNGT